jgi:hypothetical protein
VKSATSVTPRYCQISQIIALFAGAVLLTPAHAERPMNVDDAGTLDKGGYKIEFGGNRDDRTRGIDGAAGFSPIENLELEVNFERGRDRASDPATRLIGNGFAAKWVPLQAEKGLSAGLKLEVGQLRSDDRRGLRDTEHGRSLTGLATWRFESEQAIHLNLGREWTRASGLRDHANTWGVGFEQPLVEGVQLGVETYGADHSRPDKQVGLRWEVMDGLKLSIAAGRGNGRSFGNTGLAWEF